MPAPAVARGEAPGALPVEAVERRHHRVAAAFVEALAVSVPDDEIGRHQHLAAGLAVAGADVGVLEVHEVVR